MARAENRVPGPHRRCAPNALLDLAVAQILEEEGRVGTATILVRLAGAILAGTAPAVADPAAIAQDNARAPEVARVRGAVPPAAPPRT